MLENSIAYLQERFAGKVLPLQLLGEEINSQCRELVLEIIYPVLFHIGQHHSAEEKFQQMRYAGFIKFLLKKTSGFNIVTLHTFAEVDAPEPVLAIDSNVAYALKYGAQFADIYVPVVVCGILRLVRPKDTVQPVADNACGVPASAQYQEYDQSLQGGSEL